MEIYETFKPNLSEQESDLEKLETELANILQETLLFSHRGMNDPSNPQEMQQADDYAQKMEKKLSLANQIEFKIVAIKKGIDPEKYNFAKLVSSTYTDTDTDTDTDTQEEVGYHPDDLYVKNYVFDMNRITPQQETMRVYRPENINPVERKKIYNPDLRWYKVVEDFSQNPKKILNPLKHLTKLRDSQIQLGRDVKDFDSAIQELQEIVEGKPISPKTKKIEKDLEEPTSPKTEKSEKDLKELIAIPKELQDVLEIMAGFGCHPKDVYDLKKEMLRIQITQKNLGRDTKVYDDALKQIEQAIEKSK